MGPKDSMRTLLSGMAVTATAWASPACFFPATSLRTSPCLMVETCFPSQIGKVQIAPTPESASLDSWQDPETKDPVAKRVSSTLACGSNTRGHHQFPRRGIPLPAHPPGVTSDAAEAGAPLSMAPGLEEVRQGLG